MLAVGDTVNITYNTSNSSNSLKNSCHGIVLGQQNVPSANALIEISLKDQSNIDAVTRYELKQVPLFLIHAFENVTKDAALKTVGIFRKEANHTKINLDLEAMFTCKVGIPPHLSTVDVTVLIKRFFRNLQKPLINNASLEKKLIKLSLKDFAEISRDEFCSLFVPSSPHDKPALEASHLGTLGYLMLHLNKVSLYEHLHKMNPSSLATVFAPNLFPQPDEANPKLRKLKPDDIIIGQKKINAARIRCTEMLITKGNWIGQPVTPYWSSENRSRSSSAAAPFVRKYLNSCAKVLPLKDSLKEKKLDNVKLKDSKSSSRRSSSSFGVFFFGGRKEQSSKGPPQRRQTLVYNRRSSPAMVPITGEERKENLLEFATSPPSATRLSRSEHHRRSRVSTPVNKDKADLLKSPKTKPVRRLTEVSNTRAHNRSSIVRAETYNGPYKPSRDPTISLLGSDMFDETCRRQKRPAARRRNTTPIKMTGILRRDAPNTVRTGLPMPKRRATLVLREERDGSSEVEPKRRSLSIDQNDPSSSSSVDQAILNSSLLLEQKGNESRQRRTRLRSGKILTTHSNTTGFVQARKSPELESVSTPLTPSQHEFGSAIVGPSHIVDVYVMNNSPSTSTHVPMELDHPPTGVSREVKDLDATISLSEDKEPLTSSRPPVKPSSPFFRVPTLPVSRAVPLVTQRSLDSQLSTSQVSMNESTPVNPRIVARYPSGRCHMKPPLAPKPAPKNVSGKSTAVIAAKNKERISIDDNDFSFSNDIKSQILSCVDPDENHTRTRGNISEMRPSVAHIQANNSGRVKGMVQQINSINHELLSGRSSAMSSRSSLGDHSDFITDYGRGRLSGPPASHNLTTRLTPRHSYPSPLKK